MTKAEAIDNFRFFNEGDYITREMEESADIVLNILKTQQEEIEQSNKVIDKRNEEKIELVEMCLKKDKIIDEMAEEYEYNARINAKNFCEEELRKDKCIQDCRACIKKYFINKCKGVNND